MEIDVTPSGRSLAFPTERISRWLAPHAGHVCLGDTSQENISLRGSASPSQKERGEESFHQEVAAPAWIGWLFGTCDFSVVGGVLAPRRLKKEKARAIDFVKLLFSFQLPPPRHHVGAWGRRQSLVRVAREKKLIPICRCRGGGLVVVVATRRSWGEELHP
jgi:hypothetical protein